MFKPKASLHFPVGDRLYQFTCENDAPLEEVIAVLKRILEGVEKMLEEALKKIEEEKAKETLFSPVEEPSKE